MFILLASLDYSSLQKHRFTRLPSFVVLSAMFEYRGASFGGLKEGKGREDGGERSVDITWNWMSSGGKKDFEIYFHISHPMLFLPTSKTIPNPIFKVNSRS